MADLNTLRQIQNEAEQVNALYGLFDENARLNCSQAARVEFLTTVRIVERYLRPGMRILDLGAGAGEYSLYFAGQGYTVDALELADRNVQAFRAKLAAQAAAGRPLPVALRQGTALDLSAYPDASFDIVLVLGPLYHLHSEADRQRCIAEAKRVCRPGGTLFFAFIGADMVHLTELMYDIDFFKGDTYDHETFKLVDFPFVFFTVDQCRAMLAAGGVEILTAAAADGVSELLEDRINALDAESYRQYLRYHFYCCEKPEMLGRSNHLLFAGRAVPAQG